MTALRKYTAYTLIEALIVLAIFSIIAAIGFSSFYGLRDSIIMNEQMLNIAQEFRYAQRAALFLERGTNERWIYGVGVDLSNASERREYSVFKWCSQFDEYGNPKTRAQFPNFDPAFAVSSQNGNFPTTNYVYKSCEMGVAVSELVGAAGHGNQTFDANFEVSFPSDNNAVGDVGGIPVYVLYESVSGRAFLYDSSGNIVNFDSNGKMVANPIGLILEVKSNRTKTTKVIKVDNISGKVSIETK